MPPLTFCPPGFTPTLHVQVLVLAGTDRLDRALTIGQMQGRFQPVLLPQAGHAVHEDEPDHVAEALANFLRRFRIGEPPGNPRPAGAPPVLPLPVGPAFTAAPVPAPAIGPAQPAAAGRGRVAPRAPPPTFT